MLDQELLLTLKGALENITEANETAVVIRNAAAVYNACKAVPTEKDRPDILLGILNTSGLGQWPITNSSSRRFSNISEALEVTGPDPILSLYIERDAQELSSYVIQIDQVTFTTLGRNQLIHPYSEENQNITEAYKKLIEVAVRFIKPNISDVELNTIVCDVLLLERDLANMTSPPEDRKNLLDIYHRTTISEMECNFTNIPLLNLLNKEFSKANMTLNSSETLELYALEYYQKLNEYICGINPETLFNYAGVRVVLSWAADLSSEYRNASFELNKVAWGVQTQKERWSQCITYLSSGMRQVIDYLYVKEKFSAEAKKEVTEYVNNITNVFRDDLNKSVWMDNNTRGAALDKLDKMRLKIGYPEEVLNITFLQESYKYVPEFNISDHFTNMYRYLYKNNDILWHEKLRLAYDPKSWLVPVTAVDAFYNPSANEMLYPSAILQGLFYQHGLPSTAGGLVWLTELMSVRPGSQDLPFSKRPIIDSPQGALESPQMFFEMGTAAQEMICTVAVIAMA
ncbi:neprilysin-1 [Rhipicephalus sanguineus]|uniref:neprilysin-1 n=1 Tax=Rhipicephalus sanguineus TaxID=34632 RepID=UPI0020C21494|nr:neprilysin-1 [Rhipicephalus sanguineus]